MKILYGVQGTGNGHITRANAISDALEHYPEVQVDWLLTGRAGNGLFEAKGSQQFLRGLTFSTKNGRIVYSKTITSNNLWTFAKDITQLDLHGYDYFITDYEPVLSWACRLRGKKTIGIGHQYAFGYDIPLAGDNFLNRNLLKKFAPADVGLGLHWHHFDQPILPPICDIPERSSIDRHNEKVVVYLPFEDQSAILDKLKPLSNYQFFVYAPGLANSDFGHIQTRALSRYGFRQDLLCANAVITNSGFELISECLSLGIKVLTKPLSQQVEQLCNGAALTQLGYAEVVPKLTTDIIRSWLRKAEPILITYPKVQQTIAHWLATGQSQSLEELSEALWAEVKTYRGNPPRNSEITPQQFAAC